MTEEEEPPEPPVPDWPVEEDVVLPELLAAELVELLEVVDPPAPPSLTGTHVPDWQVPPEHCEPSCLAGLEHVPVVESQVPGSWQASCAAQAIGVLGTQAPDWQVAGVHSSLPPQDDPSGLSAGAEHSPVPARHVLIVWHASGAAGHDAVPQHTPSVQKPLWQSAGEVHGEPVSMRYSSALARTLPVLLPPATITSPLNSTFAVCCTRAVAMLPAAIQVSVDER